MDYCCGQQLTTTSPSKQQIDVAATKKKLTAMTTTLFLEQSQHRFIIHVIPLFITMIQLNHAFNFRYNQWARNVLKIFPIARSYDFYLSQLADPFHQE